MYKIPCKKFRPLVSFLPCLAVHLWRKLLIL
jgi:hypothetical protein